MNSISDALAINQLLGRLVYFHILFIEPSLTPRRTQQATRRVCCLHDQPGSGHAATLDLTTTPWSALTQIAADLDNRTCRDQDSGCCPSCRIRSCAAIIADCWIATEQRAYQHDLPLADDTRRRWTATVAQLIATAFAHQHNIHCTDCSGADIASTPPAEWFPMTGELARLWRDPTGPAPVVSWLNHCIRLDDIAQHLRQGSTP